MKKSDLGKNRITNISVIILITVFFIFTIPAVSSCACKQTEISRDKAEYFLKNANNDLVKSNTNFSFKLFKLLLEEDKDQDIFISPLSILTALAMAYNGTAGQTNLDMADALEFEGFDLEELNQGFKDLMYGVKNADHDIEILISNSIWQKSGFNAGEDFIKRNDKYFDSTVSSLDFSKPEAVSTINNWVNDSTGGKIEKLLEEEIPGEAVMYIIDAIYFKGNWANKFDKNLTRDKNFYLSGRQTKLVPMMTQKSEFMYYDGPDFSALRMPYGNDKFAMYVLLPDMGVHIDSMIPSLDSEKWQQIKDSFHSTEVLVEMPYFKMEYGVKTLNDVLASMGMEIAFTPEADFSGISEQVFISSVLHKAMIEVNEEGSKATAATAVEMAKTVMPAEENIEFIANRPFFFIITEEYSGSILFMGKVINL